MIAFRDNFHMYPFSGRNCGKDTDKGPEVLRSCLNPI